MGTPCRTGSSASSGAFWRFFGGKLRPDNQTARRAVDLAPESGLTISGNYLVAQPLPADVKVPAPLAGYDVINAALALRQGNTNAQQYPLPA
jgi:hypothetical protein